MKLTTLLLIIALVQASAASYSQVKLSEKNTPLEKVLTSIEKQTGKNFFYDRKDVKDIKVTIETDRVPLEVALDKCLSGLPLTYEIRANTIFLSRKMQLPESRRITSSLLDSTINVVGKVVDEKGKTLIGASIILKGLAIGIPSSNKGDFYISHVNPHTILVVSYVGYKTVEFPLNGRTNVEIVLKSVESALDEIRVIAYGHDTKRLSVGSVSAVSASDIEKQPVGNVLLALEGQVPGLVVTPTSGAPGAAVQVQVRGQNSLLSNLSAAAKPYDQPLFIIDGVPFAPQNQNISSLYSLGGTISSNTYTGLTGLSPFNNINPLDIESISVLKDADATSIYGTQGANGVILITTKKGKPGTTSLDVSVNSGVNIIARPVQMLSTQQYLNLRREALSNDGIDLTTAAPGDYPDLLVFDQQKNTDWFKQFLGKTSNNTDVHAAVSGGTNVSNYLISAGATHAGYNFPGNFADNRLTLHSAFHQAGLNNKLSIDFGADYAYDHNNSSSGTSLVRAILLPPNLPDLLDANSNLVWNYKGIDLSNQQYDSYLKQPSDLQSFTLNSSLRLAYQIIPSLRFSTNLGYSRLTTNETQKYPAYSQNPQYASANAIFATNAFQTFNIEPQLDFKRDLGKGTLTALIGGTYKKQLNNNTQLQGYDYANDSFLGSISSASTILASDAENVYKYVAVYGRLGFVYDQKYIISLTGRRDGSSNFGPGRQFGNFGSAGLGWIFSEENGFKKALPFVSFGKLSANYGTSGSDGIAPYMYQAFWQPVTGVNPFQGIRPYKPLNLYNPDYSWDLKKTLNIALDFGFFHDRILLNGTWYQSRTGNQLTNYTLPSQTGFTSVLQNFNATVQNRGLEFSVISKNIDSKNLKWSTNFNININRNTLLAFPGLASSSYANYYAIGKSTSEVMGYRYKGVNPQSGVFEFYTAGGTPTYSPAYGVASQGGDEVPVADLAPKFTGGIGNNITYKNFSLFFFFQFAKQTGANYLASIYGAQSIPGTLTNEPLAILNHWQKPGDISDIQKVTSTYGQAYFGAFNFLQSSGAYSDASYIRLKTLSLAYNLPSVLLRKLSVKSCKFYINAQNLLTITGYKVGDPELPGGLFNFPLQRTLVCGLSFNF